MSPLALTMGEPAGIGAEIALRAWTQRHDKKIPPFFLIDNVQHLEQVKQDIGLDIPLKTIQKAKAEDSGALFSDVLPVYPIDLPVQVTRGKPDTRNNAAILNAIKRAVSMTQAGEASAVVTNPIHKKTLYETGFSYAGHTEYLASLVPGTHTPIMMLSIPDLNVVPVTIHVAIKDIPAHLTTAKIVEHGRITCLALQQDFKIPAPRLAVAALNPHAGEQGTMGQEEIDLIAPAIQELRSQGFEVTGPFPADTLFHEESRRNYDAVLCMYHDQALIPLKTLDFYGGVNITLGLPFVRTSPDHGTGFDLRVPARCDSLISALKTAHRIAQNRAS